MILDLHNHTRWSFDCSMDPAKVVRVAKARGLDAIAITDHNEIGGAREAELAANGDILVIVGEEIDTTAGDLLGLFLKEKIEIDDPLEAVAAIHDQGGIAILPHPFSKSPMIDDRLARALDGCEGLPTCTIRKTKCPPKLTACNRRSACASIQSASQNKIASVETRTRSRKALAGGRRVFWPPARNSTLPCPTGFPRGR